MDTMETPEIEARIAKAKALRMTLGTFATGVTVVTTADADGKRYGLTANSFSSVSLDPPLVLWSQAIHAPSHPVFLESEYFAINILAEDQADVSNRFARWGEDKFSGIASMAGLGGAPLIGDCLASFECRTVHRYPGGDHVIFVGEIERFTRTDKRPLLFVGGSYMSAFPIAIPPAFTDAESEDHGDVYAVHCATTEAVQLARQLKETVGVAVWGNHGPTMLRWEQGGRSVSSQLRTGLVLPLLTSASGLVFGAWLPQEKTRPMMEAEAGNDSVARITFKCLPALLPEIRAKGYATVRSSAFPDMYGGDVDAVSVPVRDGSGKVVLALTAIKRSDDLRPGWTEDMGGALLQLGGHVSRRLGFTDDLRTPVAPAINGGAF